MNDVSKAMRARVLETLTLISTEEVQRNYQEAVPHVDVPAELFNQWDDCYFPADAAFQRGFCAGELEVLTRFNEVLNQVSEDTPRHLPRLEEFVKTEAWRRLSAAAREALSCLLPAETTS